MPEPVQHLSRLASLAEVHACLEAVVQPVPARQELTWQAIGHVLDRDVGVDAALPPRPVAVRDGWAVAADRVADAGAYSPVPLEPPPQWVDCGDPLPDGADAVLAPDAVRVSGGVAEALAAAAPGDNVLAAGMDAEPKLPLRQGGERLRASDNAALAAIGVDRLWTRAPRIRVSSTNPDIDDRNDNLGVLIADLLQSAGAWSQLSPAPVDLRRVVADDWHDALVTVGGTGMGRRDATVATIAQIGKVHVHGMGIRPGESAAIGSVDGRPVLMLPGRLDAALAAWLLVGRAFYARLAGVDDSAPAVEVTLARKVVSIIGLAEMIPVGYCAGGVEPLAAGFFPAQALTRAAGWVYVPPESEGFPPGSTVRMRPLP